MALLIADWHRVMSSLAYQKGEWQGKLFKELADLMHRKVNQESRISLNQRKFWNRRLPLYATTWLNQVLS